MIQNGMFTMAIAKTGPPDRTAKRTREINMRRSATVLLSAPAILAMSVALVGRRALQWTTGPITAEPTDLRQIDQAVMVIKAEDEAAALAAAKRTLDFQQANPDVFYYTRTRIYVAPYVNANGTTDLGKLLLTFFDEFDNYPVYFASLLTAVARRPAVLRLGRGFLRYAQPFDPRDHRGHITWTERQDMRVNVESRKPLYPSCGGGKAPTEDVIKADQNVAAIRTVDKAEAVAAIGARLAYARENPNRFYFTRARVFTAPYPRDRTKEMLMVFYESDDHDAYRESFSNAADTDAKYQALTEKVNSYVLDDPETRVTTWTEQQELRVRFESREPLYPSRDEGTAHVPPLSSQQRAAKLDALRSALKVDGRTTARNLLNNLVGKVPRALAAQVALGVENVVAALQTQDSNVLAGSVNLGIRRTTSAVIDATLELP
jgi:hypothetical protein